jgi:hypothetical protein
VCDVGEEARVNWHFGLVDVTEHVQEMLEMTGVIRGVKIRSSEPRV